MEGDGADLLKLLDHPLNVHKRVVIALQEVVKLEVLVDEHNALEHLKYMLHFMFQKLNIYLVC